MPIMDTLLAGAAGGIGGTVAEHGIQPVLDHLSAEHQRYMVLFVVVALMFLWFVLLPGGTKRRLRA